MKMGIKILLGLLSIIALLLIIALFLKKEYIIARALTINRPSAEVFNYIKYQKNQDYYSKWVMHDPELQKQFSGTDGTVGFIYAWEGNKKAGKGEQEITSLTEGEEVNLEIRFEKPFKGIAHTSMSRERISENSTQVNWTMKGSNPYPMNLMNLFISGMLGKDLETSLFNLKSILENKKAF